MGMDENQTDLELKQAGFVLEDLQPPKIHAHFDHQVFIRTILKIPQLELLNVETDLKLEQRNVMMEIQLMAMDVSLIEVQLNLHGFEVEDLLLPKILELSALLDYIRTIFSIQQFVFHIAVMVYEQAPRNVMMVTQPIVMGVNLIDHLLKLHGFEMEEPLLQKISALFEHLDFIKMIL